LWWNIPVHKMWLLHDAFAEPTINWVISLFPTNAVIVIQYRVTSIRTQVGWASAWPSHAYRWFAVTPRCPTAQIAFWHDETLLPGTEQSLKCSDITPWGCRFDVSCFDLTSPYIISVRDCPFATASRLAPGPTQSRAQCVPGINRPGHEADHSLPSSVEVKNDRSCIRTSQYFFMRRCWSNSLSHGGYSVYI
jgi:hypothetical protein